MFGYVSREIFILFGSFILCDLGDVLEIVYVRIGIFLDV